MQFCSNMFTGHISPYGKAYHLRLPVHPSTHFHCTSSTTGRFPDQSQGDHTPRNRVKYVRDAVKDTGKEEYLRPIVHIGLDTG